MGLTELGREVTSLSGAAFARAADVLAEAEGKGISRSPEAGRTVLDRVVTTYADEDFEALGDMLVMMLGVAKDMATPEMTGLVDRTMVSLREGQSTHLEPPSTFGLLKQLREPQTRRGLARALEMLRAIGTEPTPISSDQDHREG